MKKMLFLMLFMVGCGQCSGEEQVVEPEPESYPLPCEQLGRPCSAADVDEQVLDKTHKYLEQFKRWGEQGLSIEQMYERVEQNDELAHHHFDAVNKVIFYRFEGGMTSQYGEVTFEQPAHEYRIDEQERQRQLNAEMMVATGQVTPWLANTSRFKQLDRKRARVLSPYRFEFYDDESVDAAKMLRNHSNYKGVNDVQLIYQATLPEFKQPQTILRHLRRFQDLRKFDYVAISTHGGVNDLEEGEVIKQRIEGFLFKYTSEFALSALVLPKGLDCNVIKQFDRDDVVGVICGLEIVKNYNAAKKAYDGQYRHVLSVTSSFMKKYNSMPFSQQVVHVAACSIFSKWEAGGGTFIAVENMASVYGYKDTVGVDSAKTDVLMTLEYLLKGYTPYAAKHSKVTRGEKKYSDELIWFRARNRKFILGPKAVPTSGLRIVETARIVHWDDPRLRIRDDKVLPLHEDEFGSRRVIKGFVEIDGLGVKLANGEVICRPDTSGERLDGKWPLNLTGDLMTKTADGIDTSHIEEVKILKDQIKHVDGTTYRVPFEILLKSVPDKIIDNQRLVMRVEYPFEGSEKYGGPCGGGWAVEELEGLRIDPEPIEPKLTGKVTGKLNGTISQANTTVETKCLFPGLIFNNYNMELESTFENPQGELEYVDINLQVNESSHKLGVESFGEGKSPESISLTTHVSFVPTVDGKPSHLRSYSIPVQGQVEVRAFPKDREPGWFSVKFNVRLKSKESDVAPGEVELDFEISRYFDSHPCN